MTCGRLHKRLQAWVDGELGGRGALELERHVAACGGCSRMVENWRAAGAQLKAVLRAEIGQVETLVALQAIRGRIDSHEQGAFWQRLRSG